MDTTTTDSLALQLFTAAQTGNTSALFTLANKCGMTMDKHGSTFLPIAIAGNHIDLVKTLLLTGAKPNEASRDRLLPLQQAAQGGHAEIVKILLAHEEIDINKSIEGTYITALHIAAMEGHTEIVKILVEAGAELNVATGTGGLTALHIAVQKGYAEIVQILVNEEDKIDLNLKAEGLINALHLAARLHHTEIAKILVDHGARLDPEELANILLSTLLTGDVAMMDILTTAAIDPTPLPSYEEATLSSAEGEEVLVSELEDLDVAGGTAE